MIFFIADLYEFNTNNSLQASRSTKFCVFFNKQAQSAHTCIGGHVNVLSDYKKT